MGHEMVKLNVRDTASLMRQAMKLGLIALE